RYSAGRARRAHRRSRTRSQARATRSRRHWARVLGGAGAPSDGRSRRDVEPARARGQRPGLRSADIGHRRRARVHLQTRPRQGRCLRGLPRIRRARAHAEAAHWLEQIAGDRAAELAELIAHHYRTAILGEDADLAWTDDPVARAELRTRAFAALLAAGAVARKRYAVPQALDLHQGALQLAANDAERARGWLLAMRAYCNTRKGDPQEIDVMPIVERTRAGNEAARIGQELGDVDLQVLATRALSGLAITQGDYARAMDLTRQELPLVDRVAASRDRALGLFWLALRYMDIDGRYEEGLDLAERSHQLAKQLAPHDG